MYVRQRDFENQKAHTVKYEWNACSKSSYSAKHSKPDT